jgi:hypothetical protein
LGSGGERSKAEQTQTTVQATEVQTAVGKIQLIGQEFLTRRLKTKRKTKSALVAPELKNLSDGKKSEQGSCCCRLRLDKESCSFSPREQKKITGTPFQRPWSERKKSELGFLLLS